MGETDCLTGRDQTSIAGHDELVFTLHADQLTVPWSASLCEIHGNITQTSCCSYFSLYVCKKEVITASQSLLHALSLETKQ